MKKNGFTLVEVLLVLVILGVIAAIFIPEATKLLKENDKKIYKAKEEIMVKAAEDYVLENKSIVLPNDSSSASYVTINTLVENNNMSKILDSSSAEACKGFVKITKNSVYGYNYEACLICENYTTNKSFCSSSSYDEI